MQTKLPKVTILSAKSPVSTLTEADRASAFFQAKGPLGYELLVIPTRLDHDARRIVLAKDDRIMMHAFADLRHDNYTPLVEFLQAAFIRDFWNNPAHRVYVQADDKRRPRQEWSELMRDCNSIGYWLNGSKTIRNPNDDDIEQQYYAPNMHVVTVKGVEFEHDDVALESVSFRFLCRRAKTVREVHTADLGKNLEHLLTSEGYDATAMNRRSYIRQSFVYHQVLGEDLYEFAGYNDLSPDADPLVVEFTEHTTFFLKYIGKGRAEAFRKQKQLKRQQADWSTTTSFYKMV